MKPWVKWSLIAFVALIVFGAIFGKKIRLAELAKKPDVKIGMSKSQVINQSNWGEPKYVNRTVTKHGTHEQWVYSEYRYLYFDNGRLTVIQD